MENLAKKITLDWILVRSEEKINLDSQKTDYLNDLMFFMESHEPILLIDSISSILTHHLDEKDIINIAVGPIESVLINHESKVIDLIINHAHTNKYFSEMLKGVAANSMSHQNWTKLQKAVYGSDTVVSERKLILPYNDCQVERLLSAVLEITGDKSVEVTYEVLQNILNIRVNSTEPLDNFHKQLINEFLEINLLEGHWHIDYIS